ncbi:MAG TPA: VWA domain-containing protein [Anaerolineales bacterium]|nr:VWA domain-containing protein [Anaerolineales bacterium]
MGFLWPNFLLFLGLIPLLIAIYIWMRKRRQRFAVRYSSLSLVKAARPDTSLLRKYLPFMLFMVALASLCIALSRPVAPQEVLSGRTTIILTIDTSRSMCSTDILPSRLAAVKATTLSFVQHPVFGTQVGVVAFADSAELAQEPTTKLRLLRYAIENLTTAASTAIGSAILTSLDAIAEVDGRVAPSEEVVQFPSTSEPTRQPQHGPVEHVPHIIVLLTDGSNNAGPSPIEAAEQAAERGVRIYPIGFGTSNESAVDCSNPLHSDPSGVWLRAGSTYPGPNTHIDFETLKKIAEMTGGQYYTAESAAELRTVFQDLQHIIAMSKESVEISVFFAAVGALLATTALALSFLWNPLP